VACLSLLLKGDGVFDIGIHAGQIGVQETLRIS
jgi:hypothetical protein